MRTATLLFGLVSAMATGAAIAWCSQPAPESHPPDLAQASDPELRSRIDALEATVREVREELERLRTRGERTPVPIATPHSDATTPPRNGTPPRDPSAHRYLTMYVESFRDGGTGSEYFRLAVDAWAIQLLDRIATLVFDVQQPVPLRRALLAMLATPRFRGNPTAIQAVLAAMTTGPGDLPTLGAHAIASIGTADTVPQLERIFATLTPDAFPACLDAISSLTGEGASASFLRLIRAAPDIPTRVLIIQRFDESDEGITITMLHEASHAEMPVRRAAAERLANLYGPRFVDVVDGWLPRERDEGVRAILKSSRSTMTTVPNHHPLQATGAPDVSDPTRDDVHAWATQDPDAGIEWLEVGFATPMRADTFRIHETHRAGAIAEVIAIDERGGRRSVWKGRDPTSQPGVFAVPMASTPYPVRAVRIVLDTRRVSSFNEIDAVQLVGPDGEAWATEARASSWYGRGQQHARWRR